MLTLRFELRLTALFSQPSYFYEEPLPLPPVDIISRRRCTIPCHANILYCFKEHFLWSIWESNPFAGEHPSTDPFAYSSTAANYSTPYLEDMKGFEPLRHNSGHLYFRPVLGIPFYKYWLYQFVYISKNYKSPSQLISTTTSDNTDMQHSLLTFHLKHLRRSYVASPTAFLNLGLYNFINL